MELDLGAVRAFLVLADHQHFGAAADHLGLTQQAVSKRIAKLEASLGTALFHRTRQGSDVTEAGAAFLVHARALIALADQAVASIQGNDRPLRVDVLGTRLAPTELIRTFHETHRGVEIDIVTSSGLRSGRPALVDGTIDVAFARVVGALDPAIDHMPAYLEPLHILVGHKHHLADRRRVTLADLAGSIARMPGNEPGSEWAQFYDEIAESADGYLFSGELLRVPWHPDIHRIPLTEPTPCYPHSMLWLRSNRHPVLPRLLSHITTYLDPFDPERHWLPQTEIRSDSWGRSA
ncbi:LysR family transcriptional regulator [Nocardia sp. XZ_19_369]|uniref:LysR family transcriptional regulator n=1 Tax=Nocardia sp. XZ_19_369 TaxID=2769487 RepID=UPI00188E3FE1|nr:LysR family transcriptional regulator [Nocardia sp. XZ_19_369]